MFGDWIFELILGVVVHRERERYGFFLWLDGLNDGDLLGIMVRRVQQMEEKISELQEKFCDLELKVEGLEIESSMVFGKKIRHALKIVLVFVLVYMLLRVMGISS